MRSQLTILSESMDQKIKVLLEIQEYNHKQEEAFRSGEADMDVFDEAVEEKGRLIEKLTRLDEGFESLYEGISKELSENRSQYAEEIKALQDKIARVTELGVSIQAQEARNKKLVEEYFRQARADVRQNRQSSKAAYDYYKSMSGVALSSSRYMDQKK